MAFAVFAQADELVPRPDYGILLLAHGGAPEWNAQVSAIAESLDAKVPTAVSLGMADAEAMQQGVAALEKRRCRKIVVVPLFINSSSEVMQQTRYALGIDEKPSEVMRLALEHAGHAHGGHHAMFSLKRVKSRTPLAITPALDDHPIVAEVLYERAKGLSRSASGETVVLVGHGPVDDDSNKVWLRTIRSLAESIKERGRFKAVVGVTLRDDAPKSVRDAAVAALRDTVSRAAIDSKVIVVPYLIARGGIEEKVAAALKGLSYAWDGKTICPHPKIVQWVAQTAAAGAKLEDMRRFQ